MGVLIWRRASGFPGREKDEYCSTLGVVRVTHWLTFIAFIALIMTGFEIVISHPRFYWGEVGNVNTKPLFVIPIPSSRDTVPTGYNYVMPDQNGWSRSLHFEAAWVAVLIGLVYGIYGLLSGHFRKNLIPERRGWTGRAYLARIAMYLHRRPPDRAEETSYNVLQRSAYLVVIFVLFPLIIWTGLAMSPSFTAAFPWTAALSADANRRGPFTSSSPGCCSFSCSST